MSKAETTASARKALILFSPSGKRGRFPVGTPVLQAAREHHIDLAASWMIGDKGSDIAAGNNAGCRSILVRTGYGEQESAGLPSAT